MKPNLRASSIAGRAFLAFVLVFANAGAAESVVLDAKQWLPFDLRAAHSRCALNCCYVAARDAGKLVEFETLAEDFNSAGLEGGASIEAVCRLLEGAGLHTLALRTTIEQLQRTHYPAIVFVAPRDGTMLGHFVLFRPVQGGGYEMIDPPSRLESLPAGLPLTADMSVILFDGDPIPFRRSRISYLALLFVLAGSLTLGWGVSRRFGATFTA